MSWKLIIERTDNGYILIIPENEEEPERKLVIEDAQDLLKAHENLLWEVMEYFAFGGSKHDKERIRIIREKGDN